MKGFSIDQRLQNECYKITQLDGLSYLLHRNAEVVWFILVPHINQTEFYRLDVILQNRLCTQINLLSEFIKANFDSHKINVATIGNVVSQMHIHVIGRRNDDAYWPDVVWGKEFVKTYDTRQVSSISELLKNRLLHH